MAIRTYLTSAEIKGMINSADNLRDKVILSFLSDCGCRVSEMLAVKIRDIDLDSLEVIIPHLKRGVKKHCPKCGKTAGSTTKFCSKCGNDLSKIKATGIEERTRLVTIGPKTGALVSEFIKTLKNKSPDQPLIALSRQMVYYIVRDAADAIGLTGKFLLNSETGLHHYVHPHDFRSALAVAWLQQAGSDANKQKALQEALGHKDWSTTVRYNKITPTTVRTIGDEVRAARFGDD